MTTKQAVRPSGSRSVYTETNITVIRNIKLGTY